MNKKLIVNLKRIVVKVGTSSLTNKDGIIDEFKMKKLVDDIAYLRKCDYEVILVSSGAIGCGNGRLNIKDNCSLTQKQASAAVGQTALMNKYEVLFSKHDIIIGQILLTKEDILNSTRNTNAKNTLNELLKMNVVPIINENDTVVVDEIKVGDNDNLSALVSILTDADLLILLSDIDGIYTDNPHINKHAKLLNVIDEINETILSYAKTNRSKFSTGGMITKLEAAKKVNEAGIHMIIANSDRHKILQNIIDQDYIGSLFLAKS